MTATEPLTLYAMFGTEFRRFEQALPGAAEQVKLAVGERLARSAHVSLGFRAAQPCTLPRA